MIFHSYLSLEGIPNIGTGPRTQLMSKATKVSFPALSQVPPPMKPPPTMDAEAPKPGFWSQFMGDRIIAGWWFGTWILWLSIFFHSVGNFIIPTDFHIFQRGWNHQPVPNFWSIPSQLQICSNKLFNSPFPFQSNASFFLVDFLFSEFPFSSGSEFPLHQLRAYSEYKHFITYNFIPCSLWSNQELL